MIEYEQQLTRLLHDRLAQCDGIRIVGTPRERAGVVSFLMEGAHPHDIGTLLDQQGVAVRTGHHCTMPLMETLGVPGTVRASLALYNDATDIDRLLAGIERLRRFI